MIHDPSCFWKKHNQWLKPDQCWEVAFLLIGEERIVKIQFEPFDGDRDKHGVKPYKSKENLDRWKQIAGETSDRHFKIILGWFVKSGRES